jgi:hypothetical protein
VTALPGVSDEDQHMTVSWGGAGGAWTPGAAQGQALAQQLDPAASQFAGYQQLPSGQYMPNQTGQVAGAAQNGFTPGANGTYTGPNGRLYDSNEYAAAMGPQGPSNSPFPYQDYINRFSALGSAPGINAQNNANNIQTLTDQMNGTYVPSSIQGAQSSQVLGPTGMGTVGGFDPVANYADAFRRDRLASGGDSNGYKDPNMPSSSSGFSIMPNFNQHGAITSIPQGVGWDAGANQWQYGGLGSSQTVPNMPGAFGSPGAIPINQYTGPAPWR